MQDRASDGHALAFPGGKVFAAPVEDSFQGQRHGQGRDATADLRDREPVNLAEVMDYLAPCEAAEKAGASAQEA